MKLNRILKGVPWAIAAILGISLYLVLSMRGGISAAEFSTLETFLDPGNTRPSGYCVLAQEYMTSTTIALEIPETERYDMDDFAIVRWETASDVWSYGATGITIKDSDSDGFIDWVLFTATGGATAGGEVQLLGINDVGAIY